MNTCVINYLSFFLCALFCLTSPEQSALSKDQNRLPPNDAINNLLNTPANCKAFTDQRLFVQLSPVNMPLGPNGGSFTLNAIVYNGKYVPACSVTLAFSKSNAAITLSESLATTDDKGRIAIEVTAVNDGKVCTKLFTQSRLSTCFADNNLSNSTNVETATSNNTHSNNTIDNITNKTSSITSINLAHPHVTFFTPTQFIWTGASTHKMTIFGENFSLNPVTLVAENQATIIYSSENKLEIEFTDPKSIGDSALTLVKVFNMPTLFKSEKSGVSFVLK